MAMTMTQPPMSGLSGLVNFTDDLQEADTGLDRIALLRQIQQEPMIQRETGGMISESTLPGLQAMERVRSELEQQIDLAGLQELMMDQEEEEPLNQEDYIQYAASGGLVGLPIVQAGFGKFISRAFKSIAKPISRAVKSVGKSKLGRIALAAAPMLFGLPPWQVALISGGLTKAGGGDWSDALKAGALAYGGSKLAQGFGGAEGATTGISKAPLDVAKSTGAVTDVAANLAQQAPSAATNVFKDLAQSVFGGPGGAEYNPAGTFVSRLGERLANVGQFKDTSALEELGLKGLLKDQSQPEVSQTPQALTNQERLLKVQDNYQKLASDAAKDPSMLSNIIKTGTNYIKEKPLTAIGAGASILSSLMGGKSEAEIPQGVLDRAGLRQEVTTDFDKQVFQYFKDGQPIDTETALGLIAEAYRSYDPTGKDRAVIDTGVDSEIIDPARLGTSVESYDKFDKDLGPDFALKTGGHVDLQNNGGLIGMAYGGEFAGQVDGTGHGMEDNVYMPIIEKQAGEQIGTLAVSPDEYVVDSYTMSLLGNGSPDAGAQVMDKTIKDIRLRATGQPNQQREIDGLEALNRMRSV